MIDLAARLLDDLDHGRQAPPISASDPDFDLGAAYRLQAALTARREARGSRVIGLKVGFTNRILWDEYGIDAPIHGPVFDTTLFEGTVPLTGFAEPLIEPEIVLHLGRTPTADMTDAALSACVDAVSPAFEIVRSPYPGWRCTAADTIAAGAMHGALVLGPRIPASPGLLATLATLCATLRCGDAILATGDATNLLGTGPLGVLRHLVSLDSAPRLRPGWLISTGTLTRALPVASGQHWMLSVSGAAIPDLRVTIA